MICGAVIKMNDLLILIPTRNEVGNIDNIIAELKHYFSNSFYLFVDDSSEDGTLEILEKYSEKEPNLKVISRLGSEPNLAKSYLRGYTFAKNSNIEFVAQLDCDGQHSVIDLLELYRKRKQADVVIGSRYISGGKVIGWSNSRLLLSKIANRYLKFLFPLLTIKDFTSGMRIASTEILEKIWIISPDSVGFSFHAESTIRAYRHQLILMEVPITFKPRHVGSSKMNTTRAFESLYKFLYWKLKY